MVSTELALVLQPGQKSKGCRSVFLFFELFLPILPIEDVPLPAPGGYRPGERLDFLPDNFIETIFQVKKFRKGTLGLRQRAGLIGKICQIFFPQTIYNEVGKVGDPIFREAAHRIKPRFWASFCLMRRNIL